MSNPVFSRSDVFGEPRRNGAAGARRGGTTTHPNQTPAYGTAPQPGQYGQYGAAGQQPMDASELDAMYQSPSATTADTRRMTYDDVIIKTGGLLALLVVVAAATWTLVPRPMLGIVMIVGLVGGLVLGLVNAFKKNPSPALIVAYTVFEGAFLGAISLMFNQMAEGAVWQAVLGTASVFAVSLFLFRSGKVRVTPKFTRWLMFALMGYALFSLINFVLMITGVLDGFGMRNGPIGVIVGLVAVGLAAASLIVDFDSIKRGVEAGVPAKMAWSAAFGLLVTLIWLYLELLRLVTIISSFGSD
ncbi:putative membrane protein, YccA/Bax inhibitor family [Promicromonospora umidemergens]|uniref:Bax inhibitor-1/YccA family protein n=1 Tax=Promicromonospora umidemergens TaxID=629679 RepID=A0ABP8WEH1_9MICO|nr:Bax inhibitor-1/YccA family protein [Promicromonospora umidemergens]MCP2284385.1 putative membrane protein, YccA/Bax inhibitor family [Promicromonospora umidemergens]